MNIALLLSSVAPLRLVTDEPNTSLIALLPMWAWIATGAVLVLAASALIVRFIGRDRSEGAEARRAFERLGKTVPGGDRRLIASGAKDAGVAPVACIVCVGAFDRLVAHAPAEFRERLLKIRRDLFPEAEPVAA